MTYIQLGLDGSQARIHTCPHCTYSTPNIVDLSMHMKAEHWSRDKLGNLRILNTTKDTPST